MKNIILYDSLQRVQGFVELRRTDSVTIQVRHNFTSPNLILALTCGGRTHTLPIENDEHVAILPMQIDPSRDEVLASIILREGGNLDILASGIINIGKKRVEPVVVEKMAPPPAPLPEKPASRFTSRHTDSPCQHQTNAAREVDELLKQMCNYDEDGIEACVGCEYRKHFYFDVN